MHKQAVVVTAVMMAALLVGCGGTKRPPASATTGVGSTTGLPGNGPGAGDAVGRDEIVPVGSDTLSANDSGAWGETRPGEGGPLLDVFFGYDEASLTDQARATLEKHALWLQTNRAAKVMVEGHCDERGTVDYNLALGTQRAQAVRDYLIQLGVEGARLQFVSYGKERPIDTGNTEAAWAKNRRAHFLVSR